MASGCPPLDAVLEDVETERLSLRRFRADDQDALAVVFAKPEVWTFPFGRGFTREETGAFLDAQLGEWATCGVGLWLVAERDSHRVVGFAGLSVPHFLPEILPALEVGWRFDPDVWGRGCATEAANAALAQAFGPLGLDRVCSAPQTANPPSMRVCERLGMTYERSVDIAPNARHGSVEAAIYWITREAWAGRQGLDAS